MKKIMLIILLLSCSKIIENIQLKNKDINEDLVLAIINNETEKAKELIKESEVDARDTYGWTALMYASENGHMEIVKLLLEKGADISIRSRKGYRKGYTALLIAAEKGNANIIEILLNAGADINERINFILKFKGKSAVEIAHKRGHEKLLELLILRGADLTNLKETIIENLIINKIKIGDMSSCLLIMNNYKVNYKYKDKDDNTFLHHAALVDNKELLKEFIKRGCNISLRNINGFTALVIALQKGYIDLVKLLIDKGANVNDKEGNGMTTLIIASKEAHVEVVKTLIDKNVNIYEKDNLNKTALIYIGEFLKTYKLKEEKDSRIHIAYLILKKMLEDYIHLFTSLGKKINIPQDIKDSTRDYINFLYSLQNLPIELFEEVIKKF